MKKKIIILSSDPNSINSEIIFKTWKNINKSLRKRIYLVSNHRLMISQLKKIKCKIKITKVKDINEQTKSNSIKLIDVRLKYKNPFNVSKNEASKFIKKSLSLGHKICLDTKNVSGMINCPLDKTLLRKKFYGVTEFLASKCKVKNDSEVMMLKNKNLAICPITTHTDISNVSNQIKKKKIISKIKVINLWFKKTFKRSPKIAILGLNPHNAEFRKNSKEIKEIIPAIKYLKKLRIKLIIY